MQEEMKDCGVTCLEMIIKYYKGNVSLEKEIEYDLSQKNKTL